MIGRAQRPAIVENIGVSLWRLLDIKIFSFFESFDFSLEISNLDLELLDGLRVATPLRIASGLSRMMIFKSVFIPAFRRMGICPAITAEALKGTGRW